jgi:hypothetical protein
VNEAFEREKVNTALQALANALDWDGGGYIDLDIVRKYIDALEAQNAALKAENDRFTQQLERAYSLTLQALSDAEYGIDLRQLLHEIERATEGRKAVRHERPVRRLLQGQCLNAGRTGRSLRRSAQTHRRTQAGQRRL